MILKRSRTLHRRSGDPKRLPKCHGVEGFVGPLSGKPRDGSPLAKLYFNSTSIPQSCAAPFQRVSCTEWFGSLWNGKFIIWCEFWLRTVWNSENDKILIRTLGEHVSNFLGISAWLLKFEMRCILHDYLIHFDANWCIDTSAITTQNIFEFVKQSSIL